MWELVSAGGKVPTEATSAEAAPLLPSTVLPACAGHALIPWGTQLLCLGGHLRVRVSENWTESGQEALRVNAAAAANSGRCTQVPMTQSYCQAPAAQLCSGIRSLDTGSCLCTSSKPSHKARAQPCYHASLDPSSVTLVLPHAGAGRQAREEHAQQPGGLGAGPGHADLVAHEASRRRAALTWRPLGEPHVVGASAEQQLLAVSFSQLSVDSLLVGDVARGSSPGRA